MLAASGEITWRPGFNDPDLVGVVITVGYVVAGLLCLAAARTEPDHGLEARRFAKCWRGLGIAVLLLGLDQQMDVHELMIQSGRALALRMGWYEHRRGAEAVFLVLALGGIAVMAAMATRWLRPFFARHPLAGLGAAVLALHVLLQAAIACHLDEWLGGAWPLAWEKPLFQLGGSALVALATVRARRLRTV